MNSWCHGEEHSDAAIPLKFQLDCHAGKAARNGKQQVFNSSNAKNPVRVELSKLPPR
ncbi:MAG: hypothetical protein ABIV50_00095 [Opitutus sp.]